MKYVRAAKNFYIACSVVLSVIGILLISWPAMPIKAAVITLGVVLLVYGTEKILGYFSRDLYHLAFQFDLALGIFVALIGLVVLLRPQSALPLIAIIVGLLVVVEGVFKIQTSVEAQRFGLARWWLILIGAILSTGLGLLLLFDAFQDETLMTFVGIALLIDGLQNLFNALYTIKIMGSKDKKGYVDSDID